LEDLSLIERTKRLLARVESMHVAAKELRYELAHYGRALQAQLAALQECVGEVESPAHDDDAPIPLLDHDDAPSPPRSAARETRRSAPETVRVEPKKAAAEAEKSARPDRRRSVRRQGPPVPLLLSYSKSGDDPFKGWVNDCSQAGLGVTVEWALPVSSILTVRPVNAPTRLKWVQIEVRNCRKVRDRWHLGCRFLVALPLEDVEAYEP
jgi:hypothetical protein